ncbi:MAG TPA: putative Ig domain-containing protein [Chthoniobacterales bacterium]
MRTPHSHTEHNQTIPQAGIKLRGLVASSIGALLLFIAMAASALAVDAVWLTSPGSFDWNTDANWAPPTAPVNPGDTATFNVSSQTLVDLSADVTIDSITFSSDASSFLIETDFPHSLSLVGAGIVNNSSTTQTILNEFESATTTFLNNSTAANVMIINSNGSGAGNADFRDGSTADNATIENDGGITDFFDNSTAANAAITNVNIGITEFFNNSTAANAIITNDEGDSGTGETDLHDTSTADNAIIANNGTASLTMFLDSSSAGNATLTNAGNQSGTEFFQSSLGGTATCINANATAFFDISGLDPLGTTAGSIEGSGTFFLGSKNLSVGGNQLSTTFSGVISDGGNGNTDTGGSLTKVGTGTLTLSGANTYTGGTLINAGTLQGTLDGALGAGNVSVTTSGATLRLQSGATNNYIADDATLSIVSGSTVDLNFSGNVDMIGGLIVDGVAQPPGVYGSAASGAPHPLPVFAGSGEIQVGVVSAPVITSANNTTFTVGTHGSFTVTATGIPPPVLNESETLPAGVTFTPATGMLSGIPAAGTGGVYTITFTASNGVPPDAVQSFTLLVSAPPIIISPLEATTTAGVPFSYQFEATGATSLDVTNLPDGLTFEPALRAIIGTPTVDGIFQVTLSATNSGGTTAATLALTVQPVPTAGPVVISPTSATGRTGSLFDFQVITTGGSSAARLAVTGLPAGLTADPVTGDIYGIVPADGSYLVTLSAKEGGITNTSTLELTFTSDPAVPVIIGANTAFLFSGQPFSFQLQAPASGTSQSVIYTNVTPLPAGLALDSTTGLISGTPVVRSALQPSPNQSGGVTTNTQIFACDQSGCGTQDFLFKKPNGAINISTRLDVGKGDDVLIGGFIIEGDPMEVVARGIGPSLASQKIMGLLANPYLELHNSSTLIAANDNWMDNLAGGSQEAAIQHTTLAPTNNLESAILEILDQGSYTAILHGSNYGPGVGLVEVYELGAATLDQSGTTRLANISTRGNVQTGNNVMIGGFINAGATPMQVLVRGIGPSLTQKGVSGVLENPMVELHDSKGATIATNDDWGADPMQKAAITSTTLAPTDPLESAILFTLPVGQNFYTAVVSGANQTTGIGLVEAYFGNPCLGTSCP